MISKFVSDIVDEMFDNMYQNDIILRSIKSYIDVLPHDVLSYIATKLDFFEMSKLSKAVGLDFDDCGDTIIKNKDSIHIIPDQFHKRLEIQVSVSDIESKYYTKVNKIHHVNIYTFEVNIFKDVNYLNCSETFVNDLSELGNLHTIISYSTQVYDVSMLGRLHTLDISDTYVTDVSALGNLHTLFCCNCEITDVSMLGKLKKLDISYTNITDVSALSNVYELNCSNTKVSQVYMLNNVKILYINDTLVTSTKGLENVRELFCLQTKTTINDIKKLTKAKLIVHSLGKIDRRTPYEKTHKTKY